MIDTKIVFPARPSAYWAGVTGPELDAWASTVVKARQHVGPKLKKEWWMLRAQARITLLMLRAAQRRLEKMVAQIVEYKALGGAHADTYEANRSQLVTRYNVLGALIWKGAKTRAESPEGRFYVEDTVFTTDGVCMAVAAANPATQLSLQAGAQATDIKARIKQMRQGLAAASASARNLRPVK